jgi:multicomponent Na+:H+ antiporter subunit D
MPLLSENWVLVPVLLPIAAAILAFMLMGLPKRSRSAAQVSVGLVAAAGILISSLALWATVSEGGPVRYELGGWEAPLGINLYADGLSVFMLLTSAVVGGAGSLYAYGYFSGRESEDARRSEDLQDENGAFWPLWMFLWASINGLFLAADAFNLYVTLELLGLSAAALITLGGTRTAMTAGMRYLMVSLLGSLAYLLGVALLYGSFGALDLATIAESASPIPPVLAAIALISLGMALKTGLFPFHFWMPSAYTAAPSASSALLSGLVGKASFYLLLRLWFDVFEGSVPTLAAQVPGVLGAAAILWGSYMAMKQTRLKTLLAYSSVSQMGYLFLVFSLAAGDRGFEAWSGGIYLVFAHACAKAAMFMAAGAIIYSVGHDEIPRLSGIARDLPLAVASFAVAGITMMGLPTSGGFTAKWLLLSASIDSGAWWYAAVILVGGVLAAVYLLRFLNPALIQVSPVKVYRDAPRTMSVAAFGLALFSLGLGLVSAPLLDLLSIGAPFAAGGGSE